LPTDFIPINTDGEVEQFYLMNVEQVIWIEFVSACLFKFVKLYRLGQAGNC
jgi:hypothetical protein